jgi:Protein of unknown function (DUF3990)
LPEITANVAILSLGVELPGGAKDPILAKHLTRLTVIDSKGLRDYNNQLGAKSSKQRRYPVWANPNAELFHGTTKRHADAILRDGIDPSLGQPNTDFGRGFYTTTNRTQAGEWADAKASESGDLPVVLKLTINRNALARLRTLSFVLPTGDYRSLVERCRDRSDLPYSTEQHYDVVYGPVAKRWFGSGAYAIIEGYDQTSFHGEIAKTLLNDKTVCKVEVAK